MRPADATTCTDMPTPEFLAMLETDGFQYVTFMGAGRWCGIKRLLFHWTLIIGEVNDMHGYETRFCYAQPDLAIFAIWEWQRRGFEGEPIAWHRHPDSGRRRPDGDASREYVDG